MNEKIPVGVVGLGLMGSSIATCILAGGHRVTSLTKDIEFPGTIAGRRNFKRRSCLSYTKAYDH